MAESFEPAPPDTRLGRLQRGHGAGHLAALADPTAARDDVLACLAHEPRLDTQCEERVRYYADLVAALPVPLDAIVACVRDYDPNRGSQLPEEVLAACWRRGHPQTRRLLASVREERVAHSIGNAMWGLWGLEWPEAVHLPPAFAAAIAETDRQWGSPRDHVPEPMAIDADTPLEELLEFLEHRATGVAARALPELCRRTSLGDRDLLVQRVMAGRRACSLVATALGRMGDLRLLSAVEAAFAREDVLDDPRHLPSADRIRRVALLHYFVELPAPITLPLARQWRDRDGYRCLAAMRVLGKHAEPSDRPWLEAQVDRQLPVEGGSGTVEPLQALLQLADPALAPLFLRVIGNVRYSPARASAIEGLSRMPTAPGAAAALLDALWDAEELAVLAAVTALPVLDGAARVRVAALAGDPLAGDALRTAAGERLARG